MISTILFGIFGFLVGALVNRAAENLPPPARRSIVAVPRCGYCGTPRAFAEQVGVASFLLLRGRCHVCYSPLPLRAPIVEVFSAVVFAFLWDRFGLSWTLASYSVLFAILLLILIIDLEHRLILNVVVLPATLLALLLSPIVMLNQVARADTAAGLLIVRALLGAMVGYVLVFGIYLLGAFLAKMMARARGREIREVAFGLGDVKLAGLVGALVGFPGICFSLLYTILFGGLGALAVIIFQLVVRRRYSAFMAIPYGPYFVIAAWVFMLWGREIVSRLLG